jgi:hypothetical protein
MVKNIGLAVALGILSALLLSFALPGNSGVMNPAIAIRSVFMVSLAVVPLFCSGLGFGLASSAISVLAGTVLASIVGSPLFGLSFAFFCGLPVLIIVRQALLWKEADGETYWYPVERLLLTWVAVSLTPTIAATLLLWMNEEIRVGIASQFEVFMAQLETMNAVVPAWTADEFIGLYLRMIGPMWGMLLLFGGCLSQGILVRFEKNVRPTPALKNVKLPVWAIILFAGLVAATTLFQGLGAIADALVILLTLAFLIQGLAIVHQISANWPFRGPILVIMYLLLIIIRWPALFIIILGLVDHWVGFRERFAPKPSQEED